MGGLPRLARLPQPGSGELHELDVSAMLLGAQGCSCVRAAQLGVAAAAGHTSESTEGEPPARGAWIISMALGRELAQSP